MPLFTGSDTKKANVQCEGCEFTAHLLLCTCFSGRCSSMWDAAGACPCTGSATLSSPQEHSLIYISNPLGPAISWEQLTPTSWVVCVGFADVAGPEVSVLRQTLFASKEEGPAASGTGALRNTCSWSIFRLVRWTCRGASVQGLTAPSGWSQRLHTEEFRALADVLSVHTLVYSLLIDYRSFESRFLFSSLSC